MVHSMPLVSVVVPVYNAEQYIRQCIDSLINQTYPHLEIICINDGSNDRSLDILMEYDDKRLRIMDQTNRGCAFSRTRGLKSGAGEYFMFIDSDDWIELEAIQTLVEYAERERADAVMGTYVREYGERSLPKQIFNADYLSYDKEETRQFVHRRLFGLIGEELAHPENVDALNSNCFTLYHRDLIKHLKFGNGPYGTFSDLYFQIEALEHCERFVYIDYPLYHYRKTDQQSMSSAYKRDLIASRVHFFHILMNYIEVHQLGEEYKEALNNRIALSMIGIGINEMASSKSLRLKANTLKDVLRRDEYKKAYAHMDLHYFDLKWRTFFEFCKRERTIPLVFMLRGVNYLRKRV